MDFSYKDVSSLDQIDLGFEGGEIADEIGKLAGKAAKHTIKNIVEQLHGWVGASGHATIFLQPGETGELKDGFFNVEVDDEGLSLNFNILDGILKYIDMVEGNTDEDLYSDLMELSAAIAEIAQKIK